MGSTEVDKDQEHPPVDATTHAGPVNEHAGTHPRSLVQLNRGKSLLKTPIAQTVGDESSYEAHNEVVAQQHSTSEISTISDTPHFQAGEKDTPTDVTFGHPAGTAVGSKVQAKANVEEEEAPSVTNEIATIDNISFHTTEKLVDIDISHAGDLQEHAGPQGSQDAHPTTMISENGAISKAKGIDFSTSAEIDTSTGVVPNNGEGAQESNQPNLNMEIDSNVRRLGLQERVRTDFG